MLGCLPLGSVYFLRTSSFWFHFIDKCVSCPCFWYWNLKILLSFPPSQDFSNYPMCTWFSGLSPYELFTEIYEESLRNTRSNWGQYWLTLIWGCHTWGQGEDTHAFQVSWNLGILSLKFCHFRAMKINVVPDTA